MVAVTVKRRIKVIPDRVFGAMTDPNRAKKFMFATEGGKMTRVEIEPKVGGKYVFVDHREGEDVEHIGEIINIESPRLIEFKLNVEKYAEHPAHIKIEIENLGHWCEVVVTHEMHPDYEDQKGATIDGWNAILEKLANLIEG